ncbi:hypothetical protein EDD18DRAFT_1361060 [Armillaria luteobubalina]|uniref:Fucose-specific lectin n=1 Tax=Armillaria luteobubalina TaxID=153913 RepID=A0AA39PJU5_9AGAR|nr:hypothetical protein EDD18DRAFT_1361060 [Armillaria luteobubalina]
MIQRRIRIYSLHEDNHIQEYYVDEGAGWGWGGLTGKRIRAAPYSKLSAIYWDSRIRVYFQPTIGNDTIEEYYFDLGRPIDANGVTYPIGWLPWIGDLKSWRTYDPSTIHGVDVLIGSVNGRLIGEDLKNQQSTILKPNTDCNSYAWVYTPEGASKTSTIPSLLSPTVIDHARQHPRLFT